MKLNVKVLNGEECSLVTSPSSFVSDVKDQIQALMSIPVADQKLLFKGKALLDGKHLHDYAVIDGSKVTLVVKKCTSGAKRSPAPISEEVLPKTAAEEERPVWGKLRIFLRRHFNERDAEAVLIEFRKEFEQNLSSLSLDDIERLAITKLRQA